MSILGAVIVPHPPLIITSPHQVMCADYFHVSPGQGAAGNMSAFGAAQTNLYVEYDARLRDEIIRCGESADLRVGTLGERDPYLYHGTFAPLYFLREAVGVCCCPTWRAWTRWSGKSTLPSRRAASVPGRSTPWSGLR